MKDQKYSTILEQGDDWVRNASALYDHLFYKDNLQFMELRNARLSWLVKSILFHYTINSFMTEVPIIYKAVH